MTRPAVRRNFFARSVHAVAPDLIGATLLFDGVGGIIVEVEAYHHTDPAAHCFGGPHRAQCRDVRPARLRLRLPLLRHPLVPQLRLRAGRLGERGADPRARADRRPCRRCAAGAASTDERLLCSGPGGCARRSASRDAHNGLALDAAAVRAACRAPTTSRSPSARASASPRRRTCPGATGSRARASSASRSRTSEPVSRFPTSSNRVAARASPRSRADEPGLVECPARARIRSGRRWPLPGSTPRSPARRGTKADTSNSAGSF